MQKTTMMAAAMTGAVLASAGPATVPAAETGTGGAENYSNVSGLVWRYYEALANPGDGSALQEILDPAWHGKHEDKGVLAVEGKGDYIAGVVSAGPNPIAGTGMSLTSIQVFYDDYAMARMDARASADVTIFTLFKTDGRWRIASEVVSGARFGKKEAHMNPETATDEVLAVMDKYYQAVEFGRPEDLREVFDDGWHMKNPTDDGEFANPDGGVYAEDKAFFVQRVDGRPSPGYYDNRQVTDVQVMYDHLAVVRIDNPDTQSTTMFTYMRLSHDWKMIDKSWAFPPAE